MNESRDNSQGKGIKFMSKSIIRVIPGKMLVGGIIVILIAFCIAWTHRPMIDLNKYVLLEVSGYDGYGQATISIDWLAVKQEHENKISYKKRAQKTYGELLNWVEPMSALEGLVNVHLDKNTDLSNGDVITYTWEIGDELSEIINCKVKCKNVSYTVSELDELETFDAFENLEVTFEGIAPNARMVMQYKGAELSHYNFESDVREGLRNGDTVTISIKESTKDYLVNDQGIIPLEMEKTYTVSGLDEYVDTYESLTENFVMQLKKEAEEWIDSYTKNSYSYTNGAVMRDLTYNGYILLSIIDGTTYVDGYNNLYMIYKGVVSHSNGKFGDVEVYFPVRFSNIVLSQGELSYENMYGASGYSALENSWLFTTKGYVDGKEMCSYLLSDNAKRLYTYEISDELKSFAN